MDSNPQASPAKVNILLVEDHADTLAMLAMLLRRAGHNVRTADGYQAALDIARKERIDLAVCDIVLWDGDGSALLKDLMKVQPVKAIAITGFALDDEVEWYKEAGFAAVIPKPFDHEQLTTVISQLAPGSQGGVGNNP